MVTLQIIYTIGNCKISRLLFADNLVTCQKNDVISFSRKEVCALGLGLGLELRLS